MLAITRADLHLLELIYDCVVVWDDRRQVLVCRHCRAEDALHIHGCYYHDLARLLDSLYQYLTQMEKVGCVTTAPARDRREHDGEATESA